MEVCAMRVLLFAAIGVLTMGAGYAPGPSTLATLAGLSSARQAQEIEFTRPDVPPLPAEGKFQVVSDAAWPGGKVRLFFLGAQF
jgi:hypothetical protein